jgi:hypothetical protein
MRFFFDEKGGHELQMDLIDFDSDRCESET